VALNPSREVRWVLATSATKALAKLEQIGIVREVTGGKYGRTYCYDPYINILNEGVEQPAG
jgi:hypothetical protein